MVYLQKWPDLRVNWRYLIPIGINPYRVSPMGLIPYPKESKVPTTFVVSHNPEQNFQEILPSEKTLQLSFSIIRIMLSSEILLGVLFCFNVPCHHLHEILCLYFPTNKG